MSQIMKAALVVCLATGFAAQANAGYVGFRGTVDAGGAPLAPPAPVILDLSFTPGAGAVALITSARLTIGGETWDTLVGVPTDHTLTIIDNGPGVSEDLAVTIGFGPSVPSGFGGVVASFTATIDNISGPQQLEVQDLDSIVASEANIHALARNQTTGGGTTSGQLVQFGGGPSPIVFSGVAVPEPGSVALLSGLGLVMAGGIWRRRRKSAQKAA